MEPDREIVVYYVGEKPDTIYEVFNKPLIGDQPYCEIAGWWQAKEGTSPPEYHYVENMHRRPMLFPKEHLINHFVPDSKAIKCFDTIQDFQNDQFLQAI